MSKIIYLGDVLNNGTLNTPLRVIENLKDYIEIEAIKPVKLVAIMLDDSDGNYDMSWRQAGMSMSQLLALLEVAKTSVIRQMGY